MFNGLGTTNPRSFTLMNQIAVVTGSCCQPNRARRDWRHIRCGWWCDEAEKLCLNCRFREVSQHNLVLGETVLNQIVDDPVFHPVVFDVNLAIRHRNV